MSDVPALPALSEEEWAEIAERKRAPFWSATHYVYALIDPRNDRVRYIGCTRDPARRYQRHCNSADNQPVREWVDELRSLGMVPRFVVVAEAIGFYAANSIEERLIYEYRRFHGGLLNLTDPIWIAECNEVAHRVRKWLVKMLKVAREETGFYHQLCKRRKPRRDARLVVQQEAVS